MRNVKRKEDVGVNEVVPEMMSIRQVAATGILPEHALRCMEKQGKLPCIYSGRKCLINITRLVKQLNNV